MTRVKICGIRSLVDARVALRSGADLLGFVFYPPSHRCGCQCSIVGPSWFRMGFSMARAQLADRQAASQSRHYCQPRI